MERNKIEKVNTIEGVELGTLNIGEGALVLKEGKWFKTSPVERYEVSKNMIVIKTKNSVYVNR